MTNQSENRIGRHDWAAIKRFMFFCACLVIVSWGAAIFYSKVVVPVCCAAFLAYLLNPLVNAMESRKFNRVVASLILVLLGFTIMTLVMVRMIPFLYDQLIDLVQQIPALVDNITKNAAHIIRETLREYGIRDNGAVDRALRGFNVVEQVLGRVQLAVQGVFDLGTGLMGTVLGAVLIPILTFYFVVEKSRLLQIARKITPRDLRPYFTKIGIVIDETLTNVIRGHVKVAATLACLYSIGFTSIGLSAGVAIGITSGICRMIPYLDIVVGMLLGVTYIFSKQLPTTTIFSLVGVIGIVQILDGVLITPRLIGSKVGLHPMVVILTVIAASYKFGFLGVLLAIPCAALVKAMYKLVLPVYRDTKWFSGEP